MEGGHHDIVSHPTRLHKRESALSCYHSYGDELIMHLAINPWKFSLFQASSFVKLQAL